MKIKISKSQWEKIGKEAGWMKTANFGVVDKIKGSIQKVIEKINKMMPSQVIELNFTDIESFNAIKKLVDSLKLEIIEEKKEGNEFKLRLKKKFITSIT